MSIYYGVMTDSLEPSLTDLAQVSGLQARTIRSWVAQGLMPRPISHGPAARYPSDSVQRLLAIRVMRDLLGMSLTAIRQELLIASPEQIETYASRAAILAPEPDEVATKETGTRGDQASVLDYLRDLRSRGAPTPHATDVAQPYGFAD